jgi:hypothetical protein
MDEEEKKYIVDTKEYWKDFPESPASDSFKAVDPLGFSHLVTIRAYSPHLLLQQVGKTTAALLEIGWKPDGQSVAPAAQVQERDDNGTPVVDGDGKPIMINLPPGTGLYTVKGFYHGQNKDKTKDFLKVVVEEKPHNGKYGHPVFHPPFSEWKNWPFPGDGTPGLFAAPANCKRVVIRDAQGEGKFPEIVDFRA